MKLCEVPGCQNHAISKNMCSMHYKRMRKRGTTDKFVPPPAKKCSICGKQPAVGRGYCRYHYDKWRKYGNPTEERTAKTGEPLKFLLEAVTKARQGFTECIIWPYGTTDAVGYGWVCHPETTRAHRASLIEFTGENPRHLYALHGPCHNPLCINANHLKWGTQKENARDQIRDGTAYNKKSKLTQEQVKMIRASTKKTDQLAAEYGVNTRTIRDVLNKVTWKWVN